MISIVDDDESVRESTKALVRSLGYAARTFASAEEFLNSNPDDTSCLILDVQMEGLSGVELQERLIAEGRRTPIIFVSAFPDERIRDHALGAGAIGFLRKPFSDEKLIHCIDSALAHTIAESHQLPPSSEHVSQDVWPLAKASTLKRLFPTSRPRYGMPRRFGGTPNTHVH